MLLQRTTRRQMFTWLQGGSPFLFRCGRVWRKPPLPARLPEHHRGLQVQLPPGLPPALPVEPVCGQVVFPWYPNKSLLASVSPNSACFLKTLNESFKIALAWLKPEESYSLCKTANRKKMITDTLRTSEMKYPLNSFTLSIPLLFCCMLSLAHAGVLFAGGPTKSYLWLKNMSQPEAILSDFWPADAEVAPFSSTQPLGQSVVFSGC